MPNERIQPAQPDMSEKYKRREVLAKGLRIAKNAGLLVVYGTVAHGVYKELKLVKEVAATHPQPSQKDYALATTAHSAPLWNLLILF
jgi:hypothetical protein